MESGNSNKATRGHLGQGKMLNKVSIKSYNSLLSDTSVVVLIKANIPEAGKKKIKFTLEYHITRNAGNTPFPIFENQLRTFSHLFLSRMFR